MPSTDGSSVKADVTDAPLIIVVSCKSGSEFSAGLATQNMSAEAQILGYGTKILSSTVMSINGNAELRNQLGIPDDMSAVCVLIIGKTDTEKYDAVTSATTELDQSETVTYVK